MTDPVPTIGRIVHYTLHETDADEINRRRHHANKYISEHQERADGSLVHVGNDVSAGETYPMLITRLWGDEPDSAVNGQVFLDGNDTYWATSVTVGDGPRHFAWPTRH